jgi:mono/diheme cytochrome c family protein
MKIIPLVAFATLILFAIISIRPTFAAPPATPEQIARGKYLVDAVARCGDCHSPHNEKGEPLPGKDLRGATLDFKPLTPIPVWADRAPNIAGMRGWEQDDAVKFFMTGIAYNDLPARPPMPQYKMNKEDAEAVVAYLKSLSPTGRGKN